MDEAEERAAELERIRGERDRLRRGQQLRDETAALVVHDMKNPLSGVISNAEYLSTTSGLSDDQSECVRDILLAAKRLHRLVLSLLDVDLRERGRIEPALVKLDLVELVAAGVHGAAIFLEEKALDCSVTGASAPIVLFGDRDMLSRLIGNLIDHAVRSSPHGSRINVALARAPTSAQLRVSGAGEPLPSDLRAQLLEGHVPCDEALRGARKGRCLGLSSCRAIAEAHGGRIGAGEQAGGAVIWVELPLAGSAAASA